MNCQDQIDYSASGFDWKVRNPLKKIKNRSNLVKFNQKRSIISNFDWFWLFWSFNQLNVIFFFDLSIEKRSKRDQIWLNLIKKDQKYIKIKINNTIFTLKSKSLYYCQPNSLESDFELSRIRFWDSNNLSLTQRLKRTKILYQYNFFCSFCCDLCLWLYFTNTNLVNN